MQRHRALFRPLTAAVCAVSILLASGCAPAPGDSLTDPNSPWRTTPEPSAASVEPGDPDSPQHNRDLWVLPLDEYAAADGRIDNYAEQLLVEPCLGEAGYEWPVPWQDVDEPSPETMNASGRKLFDEQIARKWGYRNAFVDSASVRSWNAFISQTAGLNRDDGFNAAMSDCIAEVRKGRPLMLDEQFFVHGLVVRAAQEAALTPDVVAAASVWRECMLPLGIASLPTSPQEMPTQELSEELGIPQGIDQSTAEESSKPNSEEVAIAVADAACMETSGYSEALYEAEWTLHEQLIRENRETLDRNRTALESRRRDTLTLIAEHAPPAP